MKRMWAVQAWLRPSPPPTQDRPASLDDVPYIEKRASDRKQDAAESALVTIRRLKLMATDCSQQLTFWDLGPQQVTVDFDGGRVVTDAGLLPIRLLYRELGVLTEVARRLPDPRFQKFVIHNREAILTQEVYQILAGYPDGNDAQ